MIVGGRLGSMQPRRIVNSTPLRCGDGVMNTCFRFHGAPARSRRPMAPPAARSATKTSKDRFDLREALQRDRERIERNRTLPWRERLQQLRVYPWKTFFVFMALWSYAGLYAVPYLKGVDLEDGTPAVLPNGQAVPQELREQLKPPEFLASLVRKRKSSDNVVASADNRDAPRF